MRREDLEQLIHDYILTTYSATYNGVLEVTQTDDMYILTLGVPSYMTKTTIGGIFSSDEDFMIYILEELRTRNYMRVYFYKVNRENGIQEK